MALSETSTVHEPWSKPLLKRLVNLLEGPYVIPMSSPEKGFVPRLSSFKNFL